MSLSVYTRFFTLGALVLFLRLLWNRLSGHRRFPHPPGPKGWPVIGNFLDIPKEKAHEAYMGMGLKYQSDMLYLNAAGTSMLVLNSVNAANDLLVERWRLYSDRPPMPMTFLCGFDYTFVIFPYGEKWRKYRSLFVREISLSNLAVYHKPRLQQNMEMFLQSLLDSPRNFGDHVDLLYGGSLLSLAYGMSIKDPQDYFLNLIRESQHVASEVSKPGTYIVDIFPMLKYLPAWLPGMGFQRVAASYRPLVKQTLNEPMEFVKRNMANGTAISSIASRYLGDMYSQGSWTKEKETTLKNILAVLYAVGTETTAMTTKTIILVLLLYPDVLKHGQEAVDAQVGFDRLPNFGDEGKIPYVQAIVMEALRWRPVAPLGVPHYTKQADIYKGHYIPANTIVLANSWSMLHNPAIYGKDVDQFRPERFLNPDGTLNPAVPYPDATFGFGRRVCAGKRFAQSALWLTAASLLACFDFSKALDENGKEIEPCTEYVDGLLLFPPSFDCVMKPRSKTVERFIRQSAASHDLKEPDV